MTAAALKQSAPVLRTADGEPPLAAQGKFFRDDQAEILQHDNPAYQNGHTKIALVELEDGRWLTGLRADGAAFTTREQALRQAIAELLRKARAYTTTRDGEGTHWTHGYAGRVIEWALSLKPTKDAGIPRERASGTAREAPSTGGGTADANQIVGIKSAPSHSDPIIAELCTAHRAREVFPDKHCVAMTNPVVNGRQTTTGACECGAVFQFAWGEHDKMDAAIEAHWQKFDHLPDKVNYRGQPIESQAAVAPDPEIEWQTLGAIGAGEATEGPVVAALVERGLAVREFEDAVVITDEGLERLLVLDARFSPPKEIERAASPQATAVPEPASVAPVGGAGSSIQPAPIGAGSDDDESELAIEWPSYDAFLEEKIIGASLDGFEVSARDVSPVLKPHQRDIVVWAVRGGQRAIFAAFGLGKTLMQIEILRLVTQRVEGNGLVVLPLGVRQEFFRDADMLGLEFKFIRRNDEIEPGQRLYLTNYESVRDRRLDPSRFVVASLDESAVLRSYGSKTFQEFLPLFAKVRYRFVATATPSPNRFKELIHYSAFLGVMDSGQALTRFFQRDSEKAGNLTLYAHKEREFWVWVHSWACFLQAPSNLGYDDAGFALPELHVHYHEVPSNHALAGAERDGQRLLFKNAASGLQSASRERNDTLEARVAKLIEIVNDYRRAPRVSEKLLPGEPRRAARQAAQAQPQRLPEEQSGISGAGKALEGSQSGTRAGVGSDLSDAQPGEDQAGQRGLVSQQQTPCSGRGEAAEASPLSTDPGAGRIDADRAEQSVRGMRGDDDAVSLQDTNGDDDRSRSQDGEGQGPVVPSMQPGDRPVLRRSHASHEGSGLSDQIVIWCDLNAEQRAIEKGLDALGISYSSLYGDQDVEERERMLEDWRSRKTSVFLSKPVMYGAGVNLQQCHTMIFAGISYKFHDLIQAVHRIYRFLQTHPCNVHIIHSEAEREILVALKLKWAQHDQMTAGMAEIIRSHGLDTLPMREALARSIGVKRVEVKGAKFIAINNDAVAECRTWPDNSIDEIITSIPFANHYEYSASYNDFGHTDDNAHFWGQMDFLTAELVRMLKPGRLACIHVKDRILFGAVTGEGVPTISPFHAEAIMHYRAHGFQYMGMITVVTDVVRENNQTYRLGWSENCKDGTKMGVGSPEYVLLLRKPQSDRTRGYADVPVVKEKMADGVEGYSRARWQIDAHAFWRSSGDRFLSSEEFAEFSSADLAKLFAKTTVERVYDYEAHVKIGEAVERTGTLPATFMAIAPGSHDVDVWHDVNRMRTLNMLHERRGAEMHLCPLQFDIVDRLIERYSNEGDLIFDPFGGIGTVPYRALLKRRRGAMTELSATYFMDALHYLRAAEEKATTPALFDLAQFDAANTPPQRRDDDGG